MSVQVFSQAGSVKERNALTSRFASRLSTNEFLSRQIVSYQGNRNAPGFRWMKYKEGFSSQLVSHLIRQEKPQSVLDPFAGICTTPLVAAGEGLEATGIEIMPVGVLVGSAIASAANGLTREELEKKASLLMRSIGAKDVPNGFSFPHVRITVGAFPQKSEEEIARARKFLASLDDDRMRPVLDLACMSVLEAASFTRKDG